MRAATSDIVTTTQEAAGREAGITIRPGGEAGGAAADEIYVTLADSSRRDSLKKALQEVARRRHLSFADASEGGAARFDFSYEGSVTHSVHVAAPARKEQPSNGNASRGTAELAIIIDDMGNDAGAADSLLALSFPLTISVLPHLPLSTEVAEKAYRRGDQVMLHLPMESESERARPESAELRVGMDATQVGPVLTGMLGTVPHAIGVNNHEGSRATSDPALMSELMPELRKHNLFFIDSRTTAATVAFEAAERAGVRAASRKVFLDDSESREAILAQLELAGRDAEQNGSAIAIGHPHASTVAALAEGVPRLEARGIRLVFASELTH